MSKVSDKKKPYKWVEQAVVIAALRKTFRRYPPYKLVRDRCKREWFKTCKNGNKARRVSFQCEWCKEVVVNKEFVVDHIDPVVDPRVGFVDINTYVRRLFCDIKNLQGLCKPCHKGKIKDETAIRKQTRKEKRNGKFSTNEIS